jgi:small subunit ribosomal protein SAe
MATATGAAAAAPTRALSQKELDIQMMLAAEVHLGTKNCDFQMERYVFKRRNDGILAVLFLCTYPSVLDVLIVILIGNK